MTANLSYDKYMVTKLGDKDRFIANGSSNWNVYYTHAGVCRDFVNIYTIMCRELEIPCATVEANGRNHTWNIVYLNGEWIEVDVTKDIKRIVYKEDVTDVSNADTTICYNTFLNHWTSGKFDDKTSIGWSIYTKDHLTNGFPK